MRLNFKQIIASAAGAVLAAVIASFFGVKGTIAGVAIGSIVATSGTAIFATSLDKTHRAVRHAVIENPNAPTFLRQFGQTEPVGAVSREEAGAPTTAVEQVTGPDDEHGAGDGGPVRVAATEPVTPVPVARGVPGTPTAPAGPPPRSRGVPDERTPRFRWPVLAGSVAGVFVLSLIIVTCVELAIGKPLSALFGVNPHATGTSLFTNPGPTTTVPATTTTSSSATTSTTTTTTTAPAASTATSTTSGPSSTTTSTSSTTTTTTTTTVPGAGPTTTTVRP